MDRAEVLEVAMDCDWPLTVPLQQRMGRDRSVNLGGEKLTEKEYRALYKEKLFPFMVDLLDDDAEKFFATEFPHRRYS